MNIRKANDALMFLELITKYEEVKEKVVKNGKEIIKKNGKTVTFKVDYTYKTLYTELAKKRAIAAMKLKSFKKVDFTTLGQEEEKPVAQTEDDHFDENDF